MPVRFQQTRAHRNCLEFEIKPGKDSCHLHPLLQLFIQVFTTVSSNREFEMQIEAVVSLMHLLLCLVALVFF